MTQNSETTKALEKIQAIVDDLEKDKFTPEESAIIHKMIALWEAFEVFGSIANVVRNVLIWVAVFLTLWYAPAHTFFKTIKQLLGVDS